MEGRNPLTPKSKAIRDAELLSMDPRTAAKYEHDLLISNSRCPFCSGPGTENMDASPLVVCSDCHKMFNPKLYNIETAEISAIENLGKILVWGNEVAPSSYDTPSKEVWVKALLDEDGWVELVNDANGKIIVRAADVEFREVAKQLYDKVLELENHGEGPRLFDYCLTGNEDVNDGWDESRIDHLLEPLIEILATLKE